MSKNEISNLINTIDYPGFVKVFDEKIGFISRRLFVNSKTNVSIAIIFRLYSTEFHNNKIKQLRDFEFHVNCNFVTFKTFVWKFFVPELDFSLVKDLSHKIIEKLYQEKKSTSVVKNLLEQNKTLVFHTIKIYLFQIYFKVIPAHIIYFE